ncbi:MAG TPA: gliding motility lipoprotein GldH [Chitinophagaceae bacterium]
MNKSHLFRSLGTVMMISVFLSACGPINTFEKNVPIPGHEWESGFKPVITFDITDTASLYNVFMVIRHRNAYGYNNIWIRGTVQEPADTATRTQQYDLKLANDEKGWFGKGMDDIFEHRILIQERTRFTRPGEYRFKLEHTMREDPLKHVMNVGLRIEKAL